MEFSTILSFHKIAVELFFLIYLIKTALLLMGKPSLLASMTRFTKIPEMIVSTAFLVTGIWLLFLIPEIDRYLIAKLLILMASIPLAVIAFKRNNKILALLSLFLITMVYLFAQMSKMNTGEVRDDLQDGKQIYTELCTKCHGDDGTLRIAGSIDLTTSTIEADSIKKVILNGRGLMTSYKKSLSQSQADLLVDYVISLR